MLLQESIGEFLCPALDAYIEAPDEMSIAANTTSAVANVEGDTASVSVCRFGAVQL